MSFRAPPSLLLPPFPILSLLFFSLLSVASSATSNITSFSISNSPWGPTNVTNLVSENGTFTAGFRKATSNADSYFFGVWVTNSKDQFVVWSIFKDTPFNSTAQFWTSKDKLSLGYISSNQTLWSTTGDSSLQLVLKDSGELQFYQWSSFSFPNDTILPNQTIPKTGYTLRKGHFRLVNASGLYSGLNDSYNPNLTQQAFTSLTFDCQLILADTTKLVASDLGKTDRLRRLTLDSDGMSNIICCCNILLILKI
jgi:hypothetical protein